MSLRLGRFFDIDLYLHWSFWLLPLWIVGMQAGALEGPALGLRLGLLAALFACVVLHEYGHALAARRFGIATRDITLYPIGGVARLERMSEQPWQEFWIAVAGPLVNVGIAGVLGLGLLAADLVQPELLDSTLGLLVFSVLLMNLVVLCGFNLIPAFPMDGGRVLRALLTLPFGRLQATRIAVAVSAVIVVLFGFAAALLLQNPWLILIGVFLLWSGQQELRAVAARGHDADEPPLPETATAGWHGMPRAAAATVTVYLWDPRRATWVPQGLVPVPSDGPQRRL